MTTAKKMWTSLLDIYEKHTVLNRLTSRRKFHTAHMEEGESILGCVNRVQTLVTTLRNMGVVIDEAEMAMGVIDGVPDRFDGLISALAAVNITGTKFTPDFVRSRLLQEDQWMKIERPTVIFLRTTLPFTTGHLLSKEARPRLRLLGQAALALHCAPTATDPVIRPITATKRFRT